MRCCFNSKLVRLFAFTILITGTFSCGLKTPTESDPTLGKWHAIHTGIANKTIQAIAISLVSSDVVYAGTLAGVYKTTNGGEEWKEINSGLTSHDIKALVVHPKESNVVYCGTWGDGVFRSDNGGSSWYRLSAAQMDPRVQALTVDNNNADHIWVATNDGLYQSADSGANWRKTYHSGNIISVAVKPDDGETVYIGVLYHGTMKTENGGGDWSIMNNGLFKSGSIYASPNTFVFDPQNSEHIFISTGWIDIYVTKNGGSVWNYVGQEINEKSVLSMAIAPDNSTKMWAATESHGVWQSINAGETWSELNDGLPSQNSRCVVAGKGGVVYVGTADEGIFKYQK